MGPGTELLMMLQCCYVTLRGSWQRRHDVLPSTTKVCMQGLPQGQQQARGPQQWQQSPMHGGQQVWLTSEPYKACTFCISLQASTVCACMWPQSACVRAYGTTCDTCLKYCLLGTLTCAKLLIRGAPELNCNAGQQHKLMATTMVTL